MNQQDEFDTLTHMKFSIGKQHIIFLILSVLIIVASLYLPKTFYSDNDLVDIVCGWPISFVEGYSTLNPPFPWQRSCIDSFGGSPMDMGSLAQFLWLPFFLNISISFVFLNGILFIVRKTKSMDAEKSGKLF